MIILRKNKIKKENQRTGGRTDFSYEKDVSFPHLQLDVNRFANKFPPSKKQK